MNTVTIVAALLASVIPGPQQSHRECITVDTDHGVVIQQSDWQSQEWHYLDRGDHVEWDNRPPRSVRRIANHHFEESRALDEKGSRSGAYYGPLPQIVTP